MSLNHDFFLLSKRINPPSAYFDYLGQDGEVALHGDVVMYMLDTLRWIPMVIPVEAGGPRWKPQPTMGPNLYGPTVLFQEGASIANRVFTTWADLFSSGPASLVLTGPYGWEDGDPDRAGRYARIVVDRDRLVDDLRRLTDWARQVVDDSDRYILHLGV